MLNRFLLFTQCLAWLADPVTDSSPFLRPESNIVNHRSSTEFRHVRNSGPGGVDGPIYLARDSSGLFVASSAGVLRAIIYDDDILVPSIVDQPGSVTSSARHKRTSSTPAFFSGRVHSSAGRMLNRFLLFTQHVSLPLQWTTTRVKSRGPVDIGSVSVANQFCSRENRPQILTGNRHQCGH
ncbi:hypothetical protein HPB50_027891 [Hyalomma asiaticum]|nr:hypothetical protein HPB50_027891 [Hyalomma asiaticum]